ncbi:hypothetical protein RN001_008384 [Aquatica leii]|uniref:BTB domain-containing protein n=1 Tax=Aquatica leii TaxID=1421715 RepID=A0AAN7PAN7_9COLE|nr:hypothetical protein RN001_008384 [Aquatica leii]
MCTNDQYSLNWSNHTTHIKKAFDTLWSGNQFVDVTLSCEGKKISAHKMLLSACSIYFHDLFRDNPCQHPIVILRDVKFQNLVNVLKFIYSGEVSVATDNFDEFLKTAELLQISGLIDEEARTSMKEKENERIQASQSNQKCDSQKQTQVDSNVQSVKQKESARKRLSESSSVNDVTEKKRKDNEVRVDVEIKQETITEDDNFVDIKDPLDLDMEGNELTETELMQPAPSQKFVDVQDLLNDRQSSMNLLPSVKEEGTSVPANTNPCVYWSNSSVRFQE